MCDFLHLILVQYDLGLEKQARGTCLDIFGSYMEILADLVIWLILEDNTHTLIDRIVRALD